MVVSIGLNAEILVHACPSNFLNTHPTQLGKLTLEFRQLVISFLYREEPRKKPDQICGIHGSWIT